MPSYIETTMTKNENLLYSGKVSIFTPLPYFLSGLILLFIYAPLGFLVWLIGLVLFINSFLTTELGITNKRLVAKFGLFSRQTIELNLSKIESVQVRQGICGRMLNYGSIIASGTGGVQAPIPNISDPIAFRNALSEILEGASSSRNPGVAQAIADSMGRSGEQTGVEQTPQGDAIFCSECGGRNSAIASFCSKCGNKIESIA